MSFNHVGHYVCVCGEIFTTSNVFNSHKANCILYLEQKYGSYELYKQWCQRNKEQARNSLLKTNEIKRLEKELQWVAEKHICENCGKVMTDKYGSGRFCCKSCASSRKKSDETKQKQSIAMLGKDTGFLKTNKERHLRCQQEYGINPARCQVCNKALPFEIRTRKTCSEKCYRQLMSEKAKKHSLGGYQPNAIKKHHKGNYKGIHCDSSWELAYLVYCLENNIKIQRCNQYFYYLYKGVQRKYYPDFIVDGIFIEIKAVFTQQVAAKIYYFPKNEQLQVLYKKDIEKYLTYCIHKYGQEFWKVLYDKQLD